MLYYWTIFLVILAIQFFFFLIAMKRKTDKVTDLAYWSTFALVAFWLLITHEYSLPTLLLSLLVIAWWVRLAWYLFMRILAIGKDARFDWIREDVKSFAKFWTLQAVMIFILILPVLIVFTQSWLQSDWMLRVWVLIWFAGLIIEWIADWQKFVFKRENPHHRVDSWLRSKAQHPNYFGELLVRRWLFFACLPYLSWIQYLAIISPLGITWLLLFATWIPPLKKQRKKKYGDQKEFQNWLDKTNLLIPW